MNNRWVGIVCAFALIAGLLLTPATLAQKATPSPYISTIDLSSLSGTVSADGSSTVGPMTEAMAEEFAALANNVQIVVNISGTGGGFKRFCDGDTDLQDASRSIKDSERQNCGNSGVDYYEFKVAYDGIAVVVNPENDFVDCLTTDQLSQMWGSNATGTKWSDIDPSWPDEKIALYGPGTDSGTYDYFTKAINGQESLSTTDFTPSEDDNVLVEGIAGDTDALGFFGLAYFEQNEDRLKLVGIDSGNGCVLPSKESVQDLSYSPLSRPLFLYVGAGSLTRPEVQEFMRFYIAHAASIAPDVGYVASPGEVYADDQTRLESAIAGNGRPDGPSEMN